MKKCYSVLAKLSKLLAYLSGALLFLWVFFIGADICFRFVFKQPIIGSYELTELWLTVIVFASFPLVQVQKGHVGVIMAVKAMPEKLSVAVYSVATFIGCVTAGLISYAAVQQAIRCIDRNLVTDILDIPKYPFYLFEAFCMTIFCLVLLLDTINCIYGVFDQETRNEIRSHWV